MAPRNKEYTQIVQNNNNENDNDNNNNNNNDDEGLFFNKLKPAATIEFGRSPNLVKAIRSSSSTTNNPLPIYLDILARVSAFIVPSLFYIGPMILSLPFILLIVSTTFQASLIMFVINLILVFCPVKQWPYSRQFFQLWYHLFDFHHNIILPSLDNNNNNNNNNTTTLLEDKSLLIYSTHPHGVIPIHGYLWCAFCDQHFPNRYGFGALTDIALRLPLLRHVMGWLSSSSATKSILMDKMMNDGENLYILPGGVSEIFLSCPGRNVIKKPRRGLMKLALQTGAVLVPTYVFGANDFYYQLATLDNNNNNNSNTTTTTSVSGVSGGGSGGSGGDITNLIGKFQSKISRIVRGGFTFFWGQYGTPLPKYVKVCQVLGNPIESTPGTLGQGKTTLKNGKLTCKQINEPTEEEIDDLLYRYTDALVRLFEQYKVDAGYPDAQLILS